MRPNLWWVLCHELSRLCAGSLALAAIVFFVWSLFSQNFADFQICLGLLSAALVSYIVHRLIRRYAL